MRLLPAFFSLPFLIVAMGFQFSADAAMLRTVVTVEDDVIRLGDLFMDIVKKKRGLIVAAAPRPGHKATFTAGRLQRIANRAGLRWRANDRYQRSVVRRAGRMVTEQEIETLVLDRLNDGRRAEFGIELAGNMEEIFVSPKQDGHLRLADFSHDPVTRRFTAVLRSEGDSGATMRHPVSGRIFDVIRVPVLTRPVRRGEKIHSGDITTRKMRRDQHGAGGYPALEDVVGKTPRRTMRRGAVLRSSDLREPVVVARGKLVTIVLKTRNMVITARGKALEDGARGDLIRIRNIRSKSTIEGVVVGPGRVTIDIPG